MSKSKGKVKQRLIGRSRRSMRMTKTARAGQRYLIFAEKDDNTGLEFPQSVNDLRSYIYTYSIISNDVTNLVPSKALRSINSMNLRLGRAVGDYNAIKNTILGVSSEAEVSGIGRRFLRRAGGRATGAAMRVVPSGNTVFSRAAFRGIRSVAGANLTMFTDNMMNSLKPGEASSRLVTDRAFRKMAKYGMLNVDYLGDYLERKLREHTPVDSGALYESIQQRKGRGYGKDLSGGSNAAQKIVKIGNVPNMPDPRVPYPWVVEFGINDGFDKGTQGLNTKLGGIPKRFQFLANVTGPRPEGDNYFGGFYNNDNRSPYQRSSKNHGKGAMVRTAINKVLDDFSRGRSGAAMVTQRRWPTFDEVWEQGKSL